MNSDLTLFSNFFVGFLSGIFLAYLFRSCLGRVLLVIIGSIIFFKILFSKWNYFYSASENIAIFIKDNIFIFLGMLLGYLLIARHRR